MNAKAQNTPNLIILQLLHTNTDHTDFLRVCWDQLFPEQKMQIYHFLYLAKQEKTFINILRQELLLPDPIVPWTHLFSFLKKWKKLTPQNIKSLIRLDSENLDSIVFRVNTPELSELWNRKKQQVLANYENKKIDLLKDLQFAKNQGLKEKRIDALNQLKKHFPNDKAVESAYQAEKEFRARHTYHKLINKKDKQMYIKKEHLKFTDDELKGIFKTIKKYLKKNADYAYDFCIMFMEMDLPLLGLQVVDLLKKKSQRLLWHELYLSLEGQQYARALSLIAQLQKSKIGNEQSFSLLYYQAQALYGLGNRSDAIRIIKNIVKIRPQFKSAHSLLMEWETEA
ncbi:hypothetical protein K2X05_07055 [bacterium]|nr:hypothetical protein [bacterium]